MNHLPHGRDLPDLGVRPQVIVTKRLIVFPSLVELHDGGLTMPGCDVHLQVLDVLNGTLYYVPINSLRMDALAGALDRIEEQRTTEQP